jgi:S1-C subfamily serine protease/cytochrome c-type biogenesis protein CcmH/NrfG
VLPTSLCFVQIAYSDFGNPETLNDNTQGGKNMETHGRFLIPSTVFLFCFTFFSSLLAQEKLPAIVKKIEPSTVVILTYDKEEKILGQASGFFISKNGDIITNRHVLQGASYAEVKIAEGKVYPIMQIVAEDKEGDIIRLSVDIPLKVVHPLSVSASIPEVGERVVVIGSPLGLEQTVTDGIVSAIRDIPAFGNIIQITASVSPGSSGSPVVNMKGEVIGVATFQMIEGQNLNFAVPGERVAKLTPSKRKTFAEWKKDRGKEGVASAEALYSTGFGFLWAGDYEKALLYFERAVKENPRYAEAYFLIGYCNVYLRHYPEAIEVFKQAIRINPDLTEPQKQSLYYCLGYAYGELGHYPEAIEVFKQAIRINPNYAKAHYSLGVAYCELGRYNEAIEVFKQAIRINPDDAKAHCNLGVAYLNLGDSSSALKEYKILKDLDDEAANRLFNLIYNPTLTDRDLFRRDKSEFCH